MHFLVRGSALVLIGVLATTTLGARSEPLWAAAREGNLEQVRAALAQGADIDAAADGGATALFYAAQYGHPEVVSFLIERGADVNVVAEISIRGRARRVSAAAAAALAWHSEVARTLLQHGAHAPRYLVLHHNLHPFSFGDLDHLRDWEVVNTILRTPEIEAITKAIVEQDAQGTYRTHDGRAYDADLEGDILRLTAADGSVARLRSVGGKAFFQVVQPEPGRGAPAGRPAPTDQNVAMLARFLERLTDDDREPLVRQFRERGGIWLDFVISEGQVFGFEVRDGGPGRLGGAPTIFRKVGLRPAAWAALEPDLAPKGSVGEPTNWPSFRGLSASGVADGQFPPTTWDVETPRNVRWKTPIPGLGVSSPVVWENQIFITTAISSQSNPEFRPGGVRGDNVSTDRSDHVWKILSLDKQTGQVLWERTAHRGVPRSGRHLKSTFATPTAATDGEHVVALFGSEGLYCYDMEGDLIWERDLGIVGHRTYGFSSSPIIYHDMVIVQNDTSVSEEGQAIASFIAAFDLADGSERWRTTRDEDRHSSFGTPTVYEAPWGAQIITNGGQRIRAYDPLEGSVLWSLSVGSQLVTPTPVVRDDLVFVTSGHSGFQPIYAIRPNATGDISLEPGVSTNEYVVWSTTRGGAFTPTPIVYGGYLYTVNVSGILACYDAASGERMYRARLRHMGGGISSSPVAADGRLYFASEDGDVFVVKAGPEFELLVTNSMHEVILATPAISDGMIFIRTLHHLFGIG